MATIDSHSNVSAHGCRLNLGLRIAVLVLDFITIVSLLVSIGLYHTWIPRISYPTTALKPAKHTDWTDPVVLAAVLLSFIWTSFITMRPAWTSKVLHQGLYIFIEFTCLASLLACTISAFQFRDSVFENIVAISSSCDQGTETLMTGQHVPWVCMPHINTLKRLQIAIYSVACIIAAFHLGLFSLASYSSKRLSSQDSTEPSLSKPVSSGSIHNNDLEDQYSTMTTSS